MAANQRGAGVSAAEHARQTALRVLLLSQRAPDADALGGVEIHVADLVAALPPEIEPFAAYLRAGRLVVEQFRPEHREIASLPADDLADALETTLLALEADVLHLHSPQLSPDALARAGRSATIPVVLTLHDVMLTQMNAARLVDEAVRFIAPSRFIRDALARRYPSIAERTHLMQWGVPAQQRAPHRTGGPLHIAVVGVLAADKGADRLPDLMRACAHLDLEWHLFGATEGRSLRAIRRAARTVTAHGSYRRSELGSLLAEAGIDVALLASVVPESFSMTLSECAAATVPVVASDVGALGERIPSEDCGWLFDPTRPETLAQVLEGLADRRDMTRVKKGLEQRVVRTVADMAREHADLYRDVVKAASSEVAGSDGAGATARAEPAAVTAIDERRAAARRRFEAARPRGNAGLGRAWRALRRSKLYRELPLRRLLPEAVRAGVESRFGRILDRWRR